MKPKNSFIFKYSIYTTSFLIFTLLFLTGNFFDTSTPFKIPNASADAHLGIMGQPAPELNLSTWIDGNGKKTESVNLADYRGKVVYLYFFQDW